MRTAASNTSRSPWHRVAGRKGNDGVSLHSADFGAAARFRLVLMFGLAELVGDAQSYVAVIGIEEIPVAARQDGALVTLRAAEKVVGRDAARQGSVQKIPAQGSV